MRPKRDCALGESFEISPLRMADRQKPRPTWDSRGPGLRISASVRTRSLRSRFRFRKECRPLIDRESWEIPTTTFHHNGNGEARRQVESMYCSLSTQQMKLD